ALSLWRIETSEFVWRYRRVCFGIIAVVIKPHCHQYETECAEKEKRTAPGVHRYEPSDQWRCNRCPKSRRSECHRNCKTSVKWSSPTNQGSGDRSVGWSFSQADDAAREKELRPTTGKT